MSRIPQNIIDQILDQTDIVDVISAVVDLKKTGANFKACCPFHNEKTPSFIVSPQKQIYHCFGCGVGGNALTFLLEYEKLDFIEAVKRLATPLNIKITLNEDIKESLRDQFIKVNAYAHWFFQNEYQKSPKAKNYIQGRKIHDETVKTFELGYAPDSFDALIDYLKQKNIPFQTAEKLGLVKSKDNKRFYDFYRDRLIFPIHNLRGEIVGFGGRLLSNKDQAKYINSLESSVYNKSRELYGLFQAKKEISRLDEVIIVEGYTDVLSCVQQGIKNVVAPLGTSLTKEHVNIIKRYAKTIILMFDGDLAGKKAAIKAVQVCFASETHPKVAVLPPDSDPGDFLNNNKELKNIIKNSTFAMDWLFAAFIDRASSQPSEKANSLKSLINWTKRLPDSLERISYQKRLSQCFDISLHEIEKMLEITNESYILPHPENKDLSIEAWLLFLFINNPGQFSVQSFEGLVNDFDDIQLKQLAENLQKFAKKHETFDVAQAIQAMPDEFKGVLSKIVFLAGKKHTESGFNIDSCVQKFNRQIKEKKLKKITAQIVKAEIANNKEMKMSLLKEKQKLLLTD